MMPTVFVKILRSPTATGTPVVPSVRTCSSPPWIHLGISISIAVSSPVSKNAPAFHTDRPPGICPEGEGAVPDLHGIAQSVLFGSPEATVTEVSSFDDGRSPIVDGVLDKMSGTSPREDLIT